MRNVKEGLKGRMKIRWGWMRIVSLNENSQSGRLVRRKECISFLNHLIAK